MKKRITSLLLTLVMVLAMLPASLTTTAEAYLPTPNPNTPHSNNGWVELNGPLGVAALKEYLKDENNTWYIRLTGNISLDDDSFNGITVKGTKYLDLNGYSVDVNRDGGKELTLFEVPEGSTIVVCDSRGGGRIHYDGYLDMDQSCNSEGGQVKFRAIRNLFHVEGTMILNGGELDGGRSKQVWVTYSHAAGSADYYTGYVRQQLYATGIDVDGGTLIMNGGSVCGRGDYRDAIYAWNSGTVVINGGRILGLGGANALRCRDYQPPSVSIRGGYFETRKIDKEHCGRYPGAAHSSPHYVYEEGRYGDVNVKEEHLYPGAKLSTGSHSATVSPPANVKTSYVKLATTNSNIYNPNIEGSGTVRLNGYANPYYTEDTSWGKLFAQQYLGTTGTGYTPYYIFAIYDKDGKRVSDEIVDVFTPGTQPSRTVKVSDFKAKSGGELKLDFLKPYTLRCTVSETLSTTQEYTASYYNEWSFMKDVVDMSGITIDGEVWQADSSDGDTADFIMRPTVTNSTNFSHITSLDYGNFRFIYYVDGQEVTEAEKDIHITSGSNESTITGWGQSFFASLPEGEQSLRCEFDFESNGIPYNLGMTRKVYVFPRIYATIGMGDYAMCENDTVTCPKSGSSYRYAYLRPYTNKSFLTNAGKSVNSYVWQYRDGSEWKNITVKGSGSDYLATNVSGVTINEGDGTLRTYRSGDYRVMMNHKNVTSYSAAPITVVGRTYDASAREVSLTASKDSTVYNETGCTLTAKFNRSDANWESTFIAEVVLQRDGVPEGAWEGLDLLHNGKEVKCQDLHYGYSNGNNRILFDSTGKATFDLTQMKKLANLGDAEFVPGTYRFMLKVPYKENGVKKYIYSAPCAIQIDKRATGVDVMVGSQNVTNGGGTTSANAPSYTMPGDTNIIKLGYQPIQPNATIPRSPTVKWYVDSDREIATIEENTGKLTAHSPGTALVRMDFSGSGLSYTRYVKVIIPIEGFRMGEPNFGAAAAGGKAYETVEMPITSVRCCNGTWVENTNNKYMSAVVIAVKGQSTGVGSIINQLTDTVQYNDKFTATFEIKPKEDYQFVLYTSYASGDSWYKKANSKVIQCSIPGDSSLDSAIFKGCQEGGEYYNGSYVTPANATLYYAYEEPCLKDPTGGTIYLNTVFLTTDEPMEGDPRYGGTLPSSNRNDMLNVRINTIENIFTAGGYPVLSSESKVSKVPDVTGTGTAYAPVLYADKDSATSFNNPGSWYNVLYDGSNQRPDADLMRQRYEAGTYISELVITAGVAADGTKYYFEPNTALVINGYKVQLLHPSDNGTFSQADVYDDVYGYQFLGYSPGKLRATYYIVSDRQPAYNTATVTVAAPVTGEKAAVASDAIVTGVTRTGESEEIVNHGVYVRRLTWFIDANGNGQLDENEECTPENGLTADGKFLGGKTYSVYFELAVTEGMGRLNNEAFTVKLNDLTTAVSTTAANAVYTFAETEIIGYALSGKVQSYDPNVAATVKLMQGEEVKYTVTTDTSTGSGQTTQTFRFETVEPGTYDLVVSKSAHLSYTVKGVVVTGGDLDLTAHEKPEIATITLPAGDVNGDGTINSEDLNMVWKPSNYLKGADTAENAITDVNGDGTINSEDLNVIWMPANYLKDQKNCTTDF